MAGRTPADAFRPFRKSIQDAIACFAHTRVTGNTQEPGEIGILTVNRGEPLSLDSTDRQIEITCSMSYRILPTGNQGSDSWRVSTVGYVHTVKLGGELAVEFHWHPDDGSNIWYPHIHPYLLGSGRDKGALRDEAGTAGSDFCDGLSFAWFLCGCRKDSEPVVREVWEASA